MQLSDRGLSLTKDAEGCRLKAYLDTGGVWTIGYGHTGGVKPNAVITSDMAEVLLKHDLAYATEIVNENALPCTQGQFDSLVDFVFNLGPTQFLHSTLLRYHKAGEYNKAAAEFPKWKYDNGKVINGLVVRRAAEQALYMLQEPQEGGQHTGELEHSVPSVVDPLPEGQQPESSQSSPAPVAPDVRIAQAKRRTPSALLARALALLRKLAEGKAPGE